MCGIAGIVNFDGSPVDRAVLQRMTDSIAHRGPDSEGHWLGAGVGLGHRRLSIIDLSGAADQPMLADDGSEIIVFNGEIYNYREIAQDLAAQGISCRTHSDTEVILKLYRLYGPDCVRHLRGMFAFAIWDARRRCLFAARDRVGIKPFYYLHSGDVFVFASEIKAVAVSGHSALQAGVGALSGFMRFLVIPQPDTVFTDIRKLEPGHCLEVGSDGRLRDSGYWEPDFHSAGAGSELTEVQSIDGLHALLQESIRYHMVADVPVGAFLSGGLDSGAVVSLMREQQPDQPVRAFSIGFPGNAAYDESPYAREIADLKDIDFSTETIADSFVTDLEDMVWHLDEPFAVSSAFATWYLARSAARHGKVVLTGDGGDELLAGYQGYANDRYLGRPVRGGLAGAAYRLLSALLSMTGAGNRYLSRLQAGLRRRSGSEGLRYSEQIAQSSLLAASSVLRPGLFNACLRRWDENLVARYYDTCDLPDRLARKLYEEFRTRLVDEMLMKVDRMTMAHSLEARVPLLDHRLAEFAFTIPSEFKLRTGHGAQETKYVLKKVMERYLPRHLVYRDKQGFDIPVRDWLQGGFMDVVKERLLDGWLVSQGIIDRGATERLGKLHANSGGAFSNTFMLLLVLETWAGVYNERAGKISFA